MFTGYSWMHSLTIVFVAIAKHARNLRQVLFLGPLTTSTTRQLTPINRAMPVVAAMVVTVMAMAVVVTLVADRRRRSRSGARARRDARTRAGVVHEHIAPLSRDLFLILEERTESRGENKLHFFRTVTRDNACMNLASRRLPSSFIRGIQTGEAGSDALAGGKARL